MGSKCTVFGWWFNWDLLFVGDVYNAESAVWFVRGHSRPVGPVGSIYSDKCLVSEPDSVSPSGNVESTTS